MDKGLVELVMNPVRQRIIQTVVLKGTATTAQLQEALSDIPKASLYRHIKLLYEGGLLEVAKETKVRGTVMREYRVAQTPVSGGSTDEASAAVYSGLMSLLNSFRRYFGDKENDPVQDMLFLSTSTLMLTDQEFEQLCMGMNRLISDVLANRPAEGRKPRRLTVISSPEETE